MKKITLALFALLTYTGYSQTKTFDSDSDESQQRKPMTVSANAEGFTLMKQGFTFEYKGYSASFFYAEETSKTEAKYKGEGFVIELGGRDYFYKNAYYYNPITYGEIRFDEKDYNGKYRFWTLINPSFGYKFDLYKGITVDPSFGFTWRWEPRAKGTVDNKDFDNFILKAGIKVGYSF